MIRKKQKVLGLNVVIYLLVLSTMFISCGFSIQKSDKQLAKSNDSLISRNMIDSLNSAIKVKSDKYFKLDKVTVILASELDSKSNIINIQDYIENGKSFIPVFSSPDKLKESTNGAEIGKKIIEINPYFFLSLLSGYIFRSIPTHFFRI